mgnify:CR=1 FL=1
MLTAEPESKATETAANARPAMGGTFIGDAAAHLSDLRDGRSRLRAKDLVSLLLCHGARAWRSSQPATRVCIRVGSPLGGKGSLTCAGIGEVLRDAHQQKRRREGRRSGGFAAVAAQ